MLLRKSSVLLSRPALRWSAAYALAALALVGCSSPAPKTATAPPAGDQGTQQRVRLITQQQYFNTLGSIFGTDIHVDVRFAPLQRVDGLVSNGAAVAGVTSAQLEQYQHTALQVAATVVDAQHRDFLIPCKPVDAKAADEACATKFLSAMGRLLFRKPLTKEKLAQVVNQADAGAVQVKNFYAGLSAALEGMLLSPDMLLITDTYEPDPSNKGKTRLDAFSLAQRLSFFLWNAAPDGAVLKAAETGEIQTPKGRARVVDMMLASPRLEIGMRAFFDDMMNFDDFEELAKDGTIYPAFTSAAASDAREQTLRTVINFLVTEKKDYRDLYTTRETFISQSLAALYGVTALPGWTRYEFPKNSGRAGLLTQVSFLALHSNPGRSSPTLRGKALREVLLCQPVPPPPPNVDFSIVDNPNPSLHTARERLELHRKNPVCAGCHKITDPLGLALEQFDSAGMYRTTERGSVIDASGSLDGKDFGDATGLGQALHDNPSLTSCLVRRVFSYGTGGPVGKDDAELLTYLNARFAEQGYRLPDLLRTITLSPMFAEIAPPVPASTGKTASAQQDLAQNSR